MKIVTIFEPHLYSFQYNDTGDEFSELMELWTDTEHLEEYFTENSELLQFKNISLQDAIFKTVDYAEKLYDLLSNKDTNLDELFQPLTGADANLKLPKQELRDHWLRIYAIKIESKYYVITGGAIKQSQAMIGHPDTVKELPKLEQCRNFLNQQGIVDFDGFLELIL